MKKHLLTAFTLSALLLTGAAQAGGVSGSASVEIPNGNISIGFGDKQEAPRTQSGGHAPAQSSSADIPPGHMPPPGQCRIWYHGKPAEQQPAPGKCKKLHKKVPRGATLIRG